MYIKTLVENTSVSDIYAKEHGLSIYIETKKNKVLFDLGASSHFLKNAKKLEVDIEDIEFLVISHGHYDHGGGLVYFLQENHSANLYIHNKAFGEHYALRPNNKLEYIGLDEAIKDSKQIIYTSNSYFITEDIEVFSNVPNKTPAPRTNRGLLIKKNGQLLDDHFEHEQNLIIRENGQTVLFVGCAHNGIINILEYFHNLKGYMPDYVIGGFHLSSRSGKNESSNNIDQIAKYLLETKAKFYTCHCTGLEAYNRLKIIMGDKLDYLSAGSEIELL